jgi:hypothetical protein
MLAAIALCSLAGPVLAEPEDAAVKVVRTGLRDGVGSGTVIHTGKRGSFVLTNWHVAPNGASKFTVYSGGQAYPAQWVAADDRTDLALLRVDARLAAVELADELPAVGTELRQWGCSLGGPRKAKAGRLLADTARAVVWTPFGQATTADTCRVDIGRNWGTRGRPWSARTAGSSPSSTAGTWRPSSRRTARPSAGWWPRRRAWWSGT